MRQCEDEGRKPYRSTGQKASADAVSDVWAGVEGDEAAAAGDEVDEAAEGES